ncbi:MAG: Fe-S cluster assembly protein SufD [Candidatus Margulisiibacteriota bacterium]
MTTTTLFETQALPTQNAALTAFRTAALDHAKNIALPNVKQDAFLYFDLAELTANPVSPEAATVTVSGQQPGVSVYTTAQDKAAEKLETLRFHLLNEKNPFAILAASHCSDVVFIDITAETQVAEPLHIRFEHSQPNTVTFPVVMVQVETRAAVQLIIENIHPHAGIQNALVHVFAATGSEVTVVSQNTTSAESKTLDHFRFHLQDDVQITGIRFTDNGNSRFDAQLNFSGQNIRSSWSGLALLSGNATAHIHTHLNHFIGEGTSTQLFKQILSDNATSEFNGLVCVHRDAQKTDSSQSNKTLVFSDTARAYSRPQLVIDADDVKCGHGATVGQISDHEVFYLTSRGLSAAEAKALLTYGFAEEIIETIPIAGVREALEARVHAGLKHL